MIFDIKKSNNKKTEEMYERAMKELGEFFEIEWNENKLKFKVIFVPDRETFDSLKGRNTEDWARGSTMGSRNIIFIFPPEKIEIETSHKYSDETYYNFLKHELAHLFTGRLRRGYKPIWLHEGIAVYVSGQIPDEKEPIKLNKFLEFFNTGGVGVYDESGVAVQILIEQFGKKRFLEFVTKSEVENEEEFKEIFEEFFGVKLEYEWFNKMLKETR